MHKEAKIKLLENAKSEFVSLSRRNLLKARCFKILDLFIKCFLSALGIVIVYVSGNPEVSIHYLKAFGILVTILSTVSSIIAFERTAHLSMQIHMKCKMTIPEIEEKIATIEENLTLETVEQFLTVVYSDLSRLSLLSFTESSLSTRIQKE